MKKYYFLITLVAALYFTGCSSDDNTIEPSNVDTFIRFNVNGTDYNFESPVIAESANVSINGNERTNGIITEFISIWLPIGFTTGTFQLTGDFSEPGDYKIFYESEDIGVDRLAASSGEVKITSITADYIEGSFSFTGSKNGVNVTVSNGVFRSVTLD